MQSKWSKRDIRIISIRCRCLIYGFEVLFVRSSLPRAFPPIWFPLLFFFISLTFSLALSLSLTFTHSHSHTLCIDRYIDLSFSAWSVQIWFYCRPRHTGATIAIFIIFIINIILLPLLLVRLDFSYAISNTFTLCICVLSNMCPEERKINKWGKISVDQWKEKER